MHELFSFCYFTVPLPALEFQWPQCYADWGRHLQGKLEKTKSFLDLEVEWGAQGHKPALLCRSSLSWPLYHTAQIDPKYPFKWTFLLPSTCSDLSSSASFVFLFRTPVQFPCCPLPSYQREKTFLLPLSSDAQEPLGPGVRRSRPLGWRCVALEKCLTSLTSVLLLGCSGNACLLESMWGWQDMMHVNCLAHRKPFLSASCHSLPPLPGSCHQNVLCTICPRTPHQCQENLCLDLGIGRNRPIVSLLWVSMCPY